MSPPLIRWLFGPDCSGLNNLKQKDDDMSLCQLTGIRANNGMAVSHSHIRTKKLQQATPESKPGGLKASAG